MEEPRPPMQNDQDVEGEAARNARRLERQLAIREGRHMPQLPLLPPFNPHPHPNPVIDQVNNVFDELREMHIQHRRHLMMQHLNHDPQRFRHQGDDDYEPLSPQNSDDEEDENAQNIEQQRRIRREWRRYIINRMEPIPHEFIERVIHNYGVGAPNNNNNGNFRNFNGMLSPSPSPSPSISPESSDDEEEPELQAEQDDEDDDMEMLNAQMMEMRPEHPRPRKRHSSEDELPSKRKRVTFKQDSSDEAVNSLDEDSSDNNENYQVNRKQNDDDDEGFFGGPPSHHNSCCA